MSQLLVMTFLETLQLFIKIKSSHPVSMYFFDAISIKEIIHEKFVITTDNMTYYVSAILPFHKAVISHVKNKRNVPSSTPY